MILPLTVLRYAAPVAFSAIGESAVQKSGVINLGLEGTMLASAYAATVASMSTNNPWIGLLAGAVVGILITLFGGIFTVLMAQDQVVVGTAMNLLCIGTCGTLFERQSSTGKLLKLPALPTFDFLGKGDVVLGLLCLLAIGIWWLVYKSPFGLKVRAAGEYPPAVEASGFSTVRIRMLTLAIGGFCGGLGGAYYALGVANSFATEMISGRGFMAIALVTFGRWKPIWIVLSSMLVGSFEVLQIELQLSGIGIAKSLLLALPYVATLLILVFSGRGTLAPKSLGVPFKKGGNS